MVMREVDEDLAIFWGIPNGEKETNSLVEESDSFDDSKSAEAFMVAADDNFLNLGMEMEKSDNTWLLMQPDTSPLPLVEADFRDSALSEAKIPIDEILSLKSELVNTCGDASASLSDSSAKLATSSGDRKPIRRAPKTTGRPSLPAKPKHSRPLTPTLPSAKPDSAQSRLSTPVGPVSRSSIPSSRPSIPIVSKSKPRSSNSSTISAPDRSSSGQKTSPEISKSSGRSPNVKSRPSRPSEMLSLSQNAPQNLRASMPRGRKSGPAALSTSLKEKPRRKSCSPPRVRVSKMLSRSRNGDDVNPVIMGTKMVDRVVNMRKLAPPKQDEYVCNNNPRKSAQDNSGFGRSLSNKSLDMALRHMDIRRSIRTSVTSSGKSSAVGVSKSHSTSNGDS